MAVIRHKTHFLVAFIAAFIDSFKRMVASGGAGGGVSGSSAAGSSHNHVFTGTAPTAAEVAAFTGTGFATAGQVVTTTDNQTMTLNQCAGMWLLSATQPPCWIVSNTAVAGAPAVLTVYGLAPTTDAGTYKIVKAPTPAGTNAAESSHTHGAGSYAASPASSAVHYDRGEYSVATANSTDLATSLALCQSLMQAYGTHVADALAHDAVDATNALSYTRASVVSLATAITAANDLKAKYNAHLTQSGVHPNDDATNAVVASDASTTQGQLNTLLNAIKTAFNAHLADGMATPSWRAVDA
jgi:hypothetical protein